MTVNPGEVYALPADPASGHDKDGRPHIVLTKPEPLGRTITLVYCSKEDTEARVRPAPPCLVVEKASHTASLAGFRHRTFIYPTRLVMATEADVAPEAKIGVIPDLLTELRDTVLPKALGIGKGTTRSAGPAAGSPRGSVVQLTQLGIDDVGAQYALVVVDPAYGRAGFFWNVIPIYNRANLRPEDPDLPVSGELDWVRDLKGIDDALLMVRLIRAVHKPDYVYRPLLGADAETMQRVDRALLRHFEAQTDTPGSPWQD
jgi:mRNA-degrading endonuclease toxin of MazEF toxin-antitoxin module